jgi:hypothetical protein
MCQQLKVFTRGIGRKAHEIVKENWFRPTFNKWKRNVHLPTLLNTRDITPARSNRGYIADESYLQNQRGLTTTERKRRAFS